MPVVSKVTTIIPSLELLFIESYLGEVFLFASCLKGEFAG